MKIETLKIKNFKTYRNAEMHAIPNFCVLVGANGTGKSTLFNVFNFLKDCLTLNVTRALMFRGGYKEVLSRGCDPRKDDIEIEIQYRMDLTGKERLVTYLLQIGLNTEQKVCVKREILRYKRGSYGSPYHFLDFQYGKGYAITNEENFDKKDEDLTKEYQNIETPDTLALKGLGQFQKFKAANAFRQVIEHWYISDFHITSARGSKDSNGYYDHLSESGDNLQLAAQALKEKYPELFKKVLDKMKRRVPGIGDIDSEPTPDGRLVLKFQDDGFKDPFIDRYVSDGTIKMFAYLILLNDPSPFPFLCVEEPENQLYPKLLPELAEEFRDYANRGGQVFVSTHSPDFLNAVRTDELFWLKKENGQTSIRRACDYPQIVDYMRNGDQLGYLWSQGFFEGVDPK